MKKIIAFVLCAVMLTLSLSLSSCGAEAPYDRSETETNFVLIDVKGKGQIVVELYPDIAPITVANFKKLVGEGFYSGIIFHRVISDFMIQGGDPNGTGSGGSDETIKGEFLANGVENNLAHERGVISMARTNDMDSASSQFFIVHKTNSNNTKSLDGKYASFGYVVYGMDVVDDIASVKTNSSDKPLKDIVMTSVRFADVSGLTFKAQ